MSDSMRYGQSWNRDELILALELYCRIPFAKTKSSNPEVRKLATAIGRTPASVARKLGNFGAFDPELQRRHISGLGHGSKLDEQIWNEFIDNWPSLISNAIRIKRNLSITEDSEINWSQPTGPSERLRTAKQRLHQSFFRDAVLSSYGCRCAITGLVIAECLIASHIVPWSELEEARANPMNGICLSATMDSLFDRGLITFTDDFCVLISPKIMRIRDEPVQTQVACYNLRPMYRPDRFLPDLSFLAWHRQHRFRSQ